MNSIPIYYTDPFTVPLPAGHRFPMAKYTLLRKAIVQQGWANASSLVLPMAASWQQMRLVHGAYYIERLHKGRLTPKEMRRIGFPWSHRLVERSKRSVGATIAACRSAIARGVAVHLGGGTHHAFPDHGQGYCLLNDAVIAARSMQVEGLVRKVLIVDCDVHQGNGTAAIVKDDPSIFAFSIHGRNNFPFRKEQSDLDIALADGTGDEAYLEALQQGLHAALTAAEADLVIYLAGADPYEGDRLGRLSLSKAALFDRDSLVMEACHRAGLPVAVTMAGGYADRVADVVSIHLQTIKAALAICRSVL